ncbi:hypothetical protein RI367_004126 [Sorochytrium milnesiophthora]
MSLSEMVSRRTSIVAASPPPASSSMSAPSTGAAPGPSTAGAASSAVPPTLPRRGSGIGVMLTGANAMYVFQYQKFSYDKKSAKPPKMDELCPLSLFWHADEDLRRVIKQALKGRASRSSIHQAQSVLLDAVSLVYMDLPEPKKLPRNYRNGLPAPRQAELDGFSESVLFLAQALARGFVVRGIEQHTQMLIHPAMELIATFDALRFVFRSRALVTVQPPYQPLFTVVQEFDKAWVAFEQILVARFPNVLFRNREVFIDDNGLLAFLLSETVVRALERKYVTLDQLRDFDPDLMFAIPRLAVVSACRYMPDLMEISERSKWFQNKSAAMLLLGGKLRRMTAEDVTALEWKLAKNDSEFAVPAESTNSPVAEDRADTGEPWDFPPVPISEYFTDICSIADNFQSGRKAREFVPLLQKAFAANLMDDEETSTEKAAPSARPPAPAPTNSSNGQAQRSRRARMTIFGVTNNLDLVGSAWWRTSQSELRRPESTPPSIDRSHRQSQQGIVA